MTALEEDVTADERAALPATRVPRLMPSRRLRIGLIPKAFAPWAVLSLLSGVAAVIAAPHALYFLHTTRAAATPSFSGAVAVALIITGLGVWSLVHLGRLQRGTRGRGRLLLLSLLAPAAFAGTTLAFWLLWVSLTPAQVNVLLGEVAYEDMLLGLDSMGIRSAFMMLLALLVILEVALFGTLLASWYLLPKTLRRLAWFLADSIVTIYLLSAVGGVLAYGRGWLAPPTRWGELAPTQVFAGAAVGATLCTIALRWLKKPGLAAWGGRLMMLAAIGLGLIFLDFSVPTDEPERLIPAAVFLTSIAWLVIRIHARWIPVLVDGIERLGFRPLVAARHLRTRKSDFLATISVLSIGAVVLASCALTLVLSVMGGFRNDLKRKILGNNAHVVVDREHGTFGDWEGTLARVRDVPNVVGAAPYVGGEVMVTSASNLAGAVLRGIDPEAVDAVVDLRRNLTRGSLDYLLEPARLLDLPAEESFGPIPLEIPRLDAIATDLPTPDLPTPDLPAPDLPAPEIAEGPPDRAAPRPTPTLEEMLGDLGDASLASPIDEVEGPQASEPARDVLPGLVVGQELARSLRLYVGDEVNVVSPFGDLGPSGPMPKSRPFRVAGIFYSGMYEYDMKYMYSTLPEAQRFLNVGEEISGIEVKVEDLSQAPTAAVAIRRTLARDDLRVQDWQRLNRNLFGALELERLSMFIFLGLAILVAGFCVFATLTLMVQEKSPQVGILMAMGTHGRTIVAVFLLEGLLIGLFGAEMGLGLGYIVLLRCRAFRNTHEPRGLLHRPLAGARRPAGVRPGRRYRGGGLRGGHDLPRAPCEQDATGGSAPVRMTPRLERPLGTSEP